jgi:hypothetical protein
LCLIVVPTVITQFLNGRGGDSDLLFIYLSSVISIKAVLPVAVPLAPITVISALGVVVVVAVVT